MLLRLNPQGQRYMLSEVPNQPDKIRVSTRGKSMIFDVSIRRMDHAWYEWTQQGQYIQTAFLFLSPDQREFLLTGITPEEWNNMFKGMDK